MFEKFTERSRKVVVLAQEEARRMEHNYIGTEHLLLGLLREDEGVAAKALTSLNVTLDEARKQLENIVGYGEEGTGGQAPFTPRAKKILELALREASQLGHDYIGTEHLLLGLVRENEGVAARILENLDVNPNKVRREVTRTLGTGPGQRNLHNPSAEESSRRNVRQEVRRRFGNLLEPGSGNVEDVPSPVAYRARVTGLEAYAFYGGGSGVEKDEREKLLVSLEVSYLTSGESFMEQAGRIMEAEEQGILSRADKPGIDLETALEEVVAVLQYGRIDHLEEAANRVGWLVLNSLPHTVEVKVTLTRPARDTGRKVPEVSVEGTFTR